MKVKKAVVPVAGYGTRFLPAVKAIPKEMLPVVDKPTVQYVVEELVEAGVEQIIFVTSSNKRAIEDHFNSYFELEEKLRRTKKFDFLEKITRLSKMAEFVSVRQKVINGNGGAILEAKNIVGENPFICFWGDDLYTSTPSRAKSLISAFEKYQAPVLSGVKADKADDPNKYAFCSGNILKDGIIKIKKIVEKPGTFKGFLPLSLSGFVSTHHIFEALLRFKPKKGAELVYVDGLNVMLNEGEDVYAKELTGGIYHDCGNILSYLKTNVEFALKHPEFGEDFKKFIKETAKKYN